MPRKDDEGEYEDELPAGWSESDMPPGWRWVPPTAPSPEHDMTTGIVDSFGYWLTGGSPERRTDNPIDPEIAIIEDREGNRRVYQPGMPVWNGSGDSGRRRLPPRPSGRSWLPLTGHARGDSQYFLGDEYKPAAGDPATIADLQDDLARAGLLPPEWSRRGVWDNWSANAYATVLRFANAHGRTAGEELEVLAERGVFKLEERTTIESVFEEIERIRAAMGRPSSGD